MNYTIIFTSVFLNAIAQVCLKKGMIIIGKFNLLEVDYINLGFNIIKNPFLLLGFLCYGLSIVIWMFALSRVEVSFAYPFLSIGYILVMIFGYYFFNEIINLWKIFGVSFILAGVLMIAKGSTS